MQVKDYARHALSQIDTEVCVAHLLDTGPSVFVLYVYIDSFVGDRGAIDGCQLFYVEDVSEPLITTRRQ